MNNIISNNCKLFLFILLLNSINLINSSCTGCVELDELTFNKLIEKFPYTLVKFDIAFPYGEKHESYSEFAKRYGPKYHSELLISLVGIKDYGDKDNSELGKLYNINDKNFPQIMLFTNETIKLNKELIKWPLNLDININNIKNFIRDNTKLYIGMDGCLKEYDLLAIEFYQSNNNNEKLLILEKSRKMMKEIYNDNKENQEKAKIYLLFMEKIIEKGTEFLNIEEKRLKKLLTGSKINEQKKIELTQKLNVLRTFQMQPSTTKSTNDEL